MRVRIADDLGGLSGVGMSRLCFGLDLTPQDDESRGAALLLTGQVELSLPGPGSYLGELSFPDGPIAVPPFGQSRSISAYLDISHRQLALVEDRRPGSDLRLRLRLGGTALHEGSASGISASGMIDIAVPKSRWIELLSALGYQRYVLLELPAPETMANQRSKSAVDYFQQAQARFAEGEWRLTVESLRQSLAALVGLSVDDDAVADDAIAANAKEIRRNEEGYAERYELVRSSLKLLCDLAAHPDVAETRKFDAQAALLMVGGLLNQACSPAHTDRSN